LLLKVQFLLLVWRVIGSARRFSAAYEFSTAVRASSRIFVRAVADNPDVEYNAQAEAPVKGARIKVR